MNRRLCALLGPILILIPTMVQAAEGYPTFSSMFPKAFNFFLLAALLYFILKKYVIAFFKGRTERIESELSAARKAQEEAQRKAAEYEEKYRTVTDELAKLKETMRISALDEKEKILAESKEMADKMVANAKSAIEIEFAKAQAEIRELVLESAFAVAKDKLKGTMDSAKNEELVKEYVSGIRGMK
ncbi:ATP synthase F0 subunit B [Desulfurispirillum indicum]|uniref:ATP synthase F0 subunit B n=1 Tax=Desulfurispirillum indicum TaxID=936456 RepID=UPI001CFC1201|nr:ATP synthase F0 subunit B [Desulfurispirillum indicum]UCZ56328.1 ATP synthase F0 subunit B [Desulfurispirillum indicum]